MKGEKHAHTRQCKLKKKTFTKSLNIVFTPRPILLDKKNRGAFGLFKIKILLKRNKFQSSKQFTKTFSRIMRIIKTIIFGEADSFPGPGVVGLAPIILAHPLNCQRDLTPSWK